MKKILKVVLPLFIIGLLFSVNMAQGTFSVTVGDDYDFDVVAANQTITVGNNTGGTNGYELDGLVFAEGTSVNVNVTAVSTVVSYNITTGAATVSEGSNIDFLNLTVQLSLLFPIVYAWAFCEVDNWDQAAADEEFSPAIMPFVESDFDWQYFIDLAEEIHSSGATNDTDEILQDATYLEDTDDFYYEYYVNGPLDGNITTGTGLYLIDLDMVFHLQFSYEKATGVNNGFNIAFTLDGDSNGTDVSIEYNNKVERDGFDLPAYQIGGGWTWPFPAFGIIAAFTALGTIAVLVIKRRK